MSEIVKIYKIYHFHRSTLERKCRSLYHTCANLNIFLAASLIVY